MKKSFKYLAALVILALTSASQAAVVRYEVYDGDYAYVEIKNAVSINRQHKADSSVLDEKMKNRARAANLSEVGKQCSKFSDRKIAKSESTYCVEKVLSKSVMHRTCYVKNAFLCK